MRFKWKAPGREALSVRKMEERLREICWNITRMVSQLSETKCSHFLHMVLLGLRQFDLELVKKVNGEKDPYSIIAPRILSPRALEKNPGECAAWMEVP